MLLCSKNIYWSCLQKASVSFGSMYALFLSERLARFCQPLNGTCASLHRKELLEIRIHTSSFNTLAEISDRLDCFYVNIALVNFGALELGEQRPRSCSKTCKNSHQVQMGTYISWTAEVISGTSNTAYCKLYVCQFWTYLVQISALLFEKPTWRTIILDHPVQCTLLFIFFTFLWMCNGLVSAAQYLTKVHS